MINLPLFLHTKKSHAFGFPDFIQSKKPPQSPLMVKCAYIFDSLVVKNYNALFHSPTPSSKGSKTNLQLCASYCHESFLVLDPCGLMYHSLYHSFP